MRKSKTKEAIQRHLSKLDQFDEQPKKGKKPVIPTNNSSKSFMTDA